MGQEEKYTLAGVLVVGMIFAARTAIYLFRELMKTRDRELEAAKKRIEQLEQEADDAED